MAAIKNANGVLILGMCFMIKEGKQVGDEGVSHICALNTLTISRLFLCMYLSNRLK